MRVKLKIRSSNKKFLDSINLSQFGEMTFISFPTKKRRYTVLRSPHVNKKSREQFQLSIYQRGVLFHNITKEQLTYLLDSFKTTYGIEVQANVWVCSKYPKP